MEQKDGQSQSETKQAESGASTTFTTSTNQQPDATPSQGVTMATQGAPVHYVAHSHHTHQHHTHVTNQLQQEDQGLLEAVVRVFSTLSTIVVAGCSVVVASWVTLKAKWVQGLLVKAGWLILPTRREVIARGTLRWLGYLLVCLALVASGMVAALKIKWIQKLA